MNQFDLLTPDEEHDYQKDEKPIKKNKNDRVNNISNINSSSNIKRKKKTVVNNKNHDKLNGKKVFDRIDGNRNDYKDLYSNISFVNELLSLFLILSLGFIALALEHYITTLISNIVFVICCLFSLVIFYQIIYHRIKDHNKNKQIKILNEIKELRIFKSQLKNQEPIEQQLLSTLSKKIELLEEKFNSLSKSTLDDHTINEMISSSSKTNSTTQHN